VLVASGIAPQNGASSVGEFAGEGGFQFDESVANKLVDGRCSARLHLLMR
jgi:hypothetical protein